MPAAKKAAAKRPAKRAAAKRATEPPADQPPAGPAVMTAAIPPAPGGPLVTSVDALREQATHDKKKPARKRN